MFEIKINKSYEDIRIGDRIFRLDLSDEALQRFKTDAPKVSEKLKTLENSSLDDAKEAIKIVINFMFIGEPFQEIYEMCGESVLETASVMAAAGAYLGDRIKQMKDPVQK